MKGELPDGSAGPGIASAVAVPITVAGRLWGALVGSSGRPRAFAPDAESRLAGFAELVADALANADAREQLAASRARIVEVEDAERRRLERNLHDGAQQRLVALRWTWRGRVENRQRPGGSQAPARRRARGAGARAEELRELARGIHPAILSHQGLGCALDELAARAPVPVEITTLPVARLPEPVEAAAYYLVAEALTNVAKHAAASAATVRVTRTPERAEI